MSMKICLKHGLETLAYIKSGNDRCSSGKQSRLIGPPGAVLSALFSEIFY